jgi:RNA polymerase sigma factor (sigma-70 family)
MRLNSIHSITSSELNAFFAENRQRTLCYLESRFPVLQEDDIEDIFQDSSIALFLKIQNNELLDLTSSLYTFFLSICINQARNKVNRSHPTCLLPDNITDFDFEPIHNDKLEELENLVGYEIAEEQTDQEYLNWIEQQVREGVRQMKPPCNQILWSFYWDGLSHRTIADMFGMKSEDVSKTQANRCKHKFSDFIKKVIASYER